VRDALARITGFEAVTGTISYRDGGRIPDKSVSIIAVEQGRERGSGPRAAQENPATLMVVEIGCGTATRGLRARHSCGPWRGAPFAPVRVDLVPIRHGGVLCPAFRCGRGHNPVYERALVVPAPRVRQLNRLAEFAAIV
jgi:hypothetical protein